MSKKCSTIVKKLTCSLCILSLLSSKTIFSDIRIVSADTQTEQELAVKEVSVTDIEEYENNEIVVVYKDEVDENRYLPEGVTQETITEDCALVETENKKDLEEAIETLQEDSDVAYVQPNYTYYALEAVSNDKYSDYQWAYSGDYNIGITDAWNMGKGANKEVIVAITDTGIDYNHVDLKDGIWKNPKEIPENNKDDDMNGFKDDIYGWNFVANNNKICEYKYTAEEYADDHGTHIAGIINAAADNEVGIAGIASKANVKLMSVKVFSDDGSTSTAALIKGIRYAEDNGASICNMSLGGDASNSFGDQLLYDTMKESAMLFICAAGNGTKATLGKGFDITTHPQAPASYDLDNIICVANMNKTGVIDESSCYSSKEVDIAAPGTDIASTVVDPKKSSTGAYLVMTGTSMSTPMAAGVAAMLESYYGEMTAEQMKEAILSGARVNENLSNKVAGNRMLSAIGAMDYYQNHFLMNAKVSNISNSNNKKVTIRVTDYKGTVNKIYYVSGAKTEDDFAANALGTALTVSNNKASFTVKKSGIYTIYAENSNGVKQVMKLKVTVPALKSAKLSATKKSLKKGKTYQLKTTVSPSGLYTKATYKTSNPSIAKVSSSGKITAKKKGKAKITVKISDGTKKKTLTCTVTVTG